jgi:hypothetical protein
MYRQKNEQGKVAARRPGCGQLWTKGVDRILWRLLFVDLEFGEDNDNTITKLARIR